MYVCMYVCMVCMYVCMYVCMHLCVYVFMYVNQTWLKLFHSPTTCLEKNPLNMKEYLSFKLLKEILPNTSLYQSQIQKNLQEPDIMVSELKTKNENYEKLQPIFCVNRSTKIVTPSRKSQTSSLFRFIHHKFLTTNFVKIAWQREMLLLVETSNFLLWRSLDLKMFY